MSLPGVGLFSVVVSALVAELPAPAQTHRVVPELLIPVLARTGPVAFWAGATLCLALGLGSNLVLRTIAEAHRGRRFLALNACSAASAVLVSGALAVGGLLAHPSGSGRTEEPGAALVALSWALCWTLLWGMLGSALTALLNPTRPPARLGWVLYCRIGVALVLLVATACSTVGLVFSARAEEGRSPLEKDVLLSPPNPPTPSPSPSDPALLTNPDPERGFEGRCAGEAIRVEYRTADAAAGRRFGLLTATNAGASACLLKGYPDLAFADVLGNEVRVKLGHGNWQLRPEKVRAIKLAPGETARAELTWRGDSGALDRETNGILAAPWAGTKRTLISEHFDVKNGSKMSVSPWLPTK